MARVRPQRDLRADNAVGVSGVAGDGTVNGVINGIADAISSELSGPFAGDAGVRSWRPPV